MKIRKEKTKKMISLRKLNNIITLLVRLIIVALAILMIVQKDYEKLGYLAITSVLTFYNIFIRKVVKIRLPEILKIVLILFIFSAQVLGSVLDFYDKFYWWDTMLHTISGMIFFLIGVVVIKYLNKSKTNVKIGRNLIIVFAICFSLSIGVIWEIIEYTIDCIFVTSNMQITKGLIGQAAIKDTMIDLISATIGTLIMAFFQKIQMKHKGIKKEG